MAYQTIRDLVAHVRKLHRRLRDLVSEAEMQEEDERTALLLEFIDEHESVLERAVVAAEQKGGKAVLDTWLQFEQTNELDRAMRQGEPTSSPSGDEIVDHVLRTENALIRLYELLQGSTSSSSVQTFFASLMELEDSAVRRSARVRLEAGDL